jgi:CubicO group peptidase (beta-lactamase class C family)
LILLWTPSSFSQTLEEKLDRRIRIYVDSLKFSGAILVAHKGQILLDKAYGYADISEGVRNQKDTKFLIGSLTKSFTAVTVMQLVEEGLLDLHTPVSEYLTYMDVPVGGITLHQLLTMTSGLPGHLGELTELKYEDISSRELAKLINKANLEFDPGTRYRYSNLGYQLAACLIAEVTGKTFHEVLTKYTFNPLKMENSGNETTYTIPEKRASGHEVRNGTMILASRNYMSYSQGSGDVYSTIGDLYKWARALYEEDYLSKESRNCLFNGKPDINDGYGYGFKIRNYRRKDGIGKLVRHGGSMQGFLTNFHYYMEDDIIVIILGNMRPFPIMDIAFDLKELVLGRNPGREGKEYRY